MTRVFLAVLALAVVSVAQGAERSPPTADHSKFEALKGPFEDATEVTEACLGCHTEAADQVKGTTHWTWLYDHPETGQQLGKSKVINSFCGMAVTNEARCTSCHVGYGWEDMNQPPPQADSAVDCLVCHDTTGDYWKFPTLAGYPTYVPREWPKGSGNPYVLAHRPHGATGGECAALRILSCRREPAGWHWPHLYAGP